MVYSFVLLYVFEFTASPLQQLKGVKFFFNSRERKIMVLKFLTPINLSKDCVDSSECTEQLQIDMHIFANLGKRFGYRNLIM